MLSYQLGSLGYVFTLTQARFMIVEAFYLPLSYIRPPIHRIYPLIQTSCPSLFLKNLSKSSVKS